MNKGVCSKIKKIRLRKNFSQEYMAIRLGISTSQYIKIENGYKGLTLVMLVQISEILDTNPTKLFEDTVFEFYHYGFFQLEKLAPKKTKKKK